jgi:hypothetical protein
MELRWRSEWTVPAVVGVVSFGVGAAVGYFIAARHVKALEDMLDDFVEGVTGEKKVEEDLQTLFDEEGHGRDGWTTSRVIEEEVEVVVLEEDTDIEVADFRAVNRSVFPVATPDWDYEIEIASRTSEAPYIIHKDEFFATEAEGYSQCTLTYYKGDDVLLDDHDVPLYDAKKIVGENLIFGKGSEDPSIVYIRNDRLEAEYEVILDTGYYMVEVLGEELEHSFDRKPPLHKFKE